MYDSEKLNQLIETLGWEKSDEITVEVGGAATYEIEEIVRSEQAIA